MRFITSLNARSCSTLSMAACLIAVMLTSANPATLSAEDAAAKLAPVPNPDAEADSPEKMKPYTELLEHTEESIELVPIPGGTFTMGSPEEEADRNDDEGPQHQVKIDPFWMGKYEITWDQYDVWTEQMDQLRRKMMAKKAGERDLLVDGVSRPTEPYTDMSFGRGKGRHPAICMTQHSARVFCKWLTAKTGRYYRLPTEAEWEYACRAGTKTAYSFGDDVSDLGEYAWFFDNTEDKYEKVGQKKPNPWGLYDMHGNVAEWVLDQYVPDNYAAAGTGVISNPLQIPTELYPRVVRGGSWDDDAEILRSAARVYSDPDWKQQDPQLPRSIWYHTDALGVGFRVVRPFEEPTEAEKEQKWEKTAPEQLDPEEG
ncbi:Serine/threonine-protein kinase pkn1 [Roseimaritima multifibrata]|uniref:Serine/threonine-protein kinase pkn1 n=1 Tax=Roseimaritima multifibrata TaxID=1930274 RepID=A0A517MGN0_9BACT|nr:formylglycine-generating enzyme family protein [Roseimaritima multifibrata]QDS94043.1 Serine/threonine-protein kinase pkn1 [Roseimaritima multifibrata]